MAAARTHCLVLARLHVTPLAFGSRVICTSNGVADIPAGLYPSSNPARRHRKGQAIVRRTDVQTPIGHN